MAAEKILDNIDNILEEKISFQEQNHSEATYASKIEKSEGQIKWNETAEKIIGKINGLFPSPGAFFEYKGERYKILKAELTTIAGEAGEVLDDYLEIGCGNKKSIKVLEIQRQGKRVQNISEFMLGSKIKRGSNLNNA
jgi:methionyl-tRNA formyltransferase